MSVYASKRNESKAEFIRVAQQLATYTLEQVKKFPKSYRFCLTNDIVRLALEIHEDVLRANSIYLHNNIMETEFNLREEYFTKARSAIFALSSLRYQSKKTWSKIVSFKFFCEFLDYLKQELWEYIKRDGNPKPKKNETDNTNESEVVLPEDIFNIEESE